MRNGQYSAPAWAPFSKRMYHVTPWLDPTRSRIRKRVVNDGSIKWYAMLPWNRLFRASKNLNRAVVVVMALILQGDLGRNLCLWSRDLARPMLLFSQPSLVAELWSIACWVSCFPTADRCCKMACVSGISRVERRRVTAGLVRLLFGMTRLLHYLIGTCALQCSFIYYRFPCRFNLEALERPAPWRPGQIGFVHSARWRGYALRNAPALMVRCLSTRRI